MRPIRKIIIHCSATPEGKAFTADDIRLWHVRGNGWSDIGYHYVVLLDGTIQKGRPEETLGAHCAGHNHDSIGVCYIGGMTADGRHPKDTRTPAQHAALDWLIEQLKARFPSAAVYGHNHFNPAKSCPSFAVRSE